jgi:hypothetical protein
VNARKPTSWQSPLAPLFGPKFAGTLEFGAQVAPTWRLNQNTAERVAVWHCLVEIVPRRIAIEVVHGADVTHRTHKAAVAVTVVEIEFYPSLPGLKNLDSRGSPWPSGR